MCERLFLKVVFLKGKTKSTFRAICLIKYSHSGIASNTSWQCIYSNSKEEDKQTKMI